MCRVLRYLTSLLEYYTGPFEAKRIGLAMMGLVGLPADLKEGEALINALAIKADSVQVRSHVFLFVSLILCIPLTDTV
jgi:hypothetical protein